MTTTENKVSNPWIGRPVVDLDGKHLGSLESVFGTAGDAGWLVVADSTAGTTYIPATLAQAHGGAVHVPYSTELIMRAPADDFDETALARYYGVTVDRVATIVAPPVAAPLPPAPPAPVVDAAPVVDTEPVGEAAAVVETAPALETPTVQSFVVDAPAPGTHEIIDLVDVPADKITVTEVPSDTPVTARRVVVERPADGLIDEIIRWEEEVILDVARVERGRVRVRKIIIQEDLHLTIPVRREVARIIIEPIIEGEYSGAHPTELAGMETEVVLHEERAIVTTEFVPKERLRLVVDTVTTDSPVTARVRREKFEYDSDQDGLFERL